MANRKPPSRSFGTVRKLPSGRFQARYWAPDGERRAARRADGKPLTFGTKGDAEAWLSLRQAEILRHEWQPPASSAARPVSLRTYADAWTAQRRLEDRTREHYEQLLRDHIYPALAEHSVSTMTPAEVRTWYSGLATGPTAKAHAYDLLRGIFKTAVDDELIAANPCRIRGAGQAKRAKKIRPASLAEIEIIVKSVPDRYRLMVLFAAWLALRFGELAELRRGDVDLVNCIVHVRRGVVRTKKGRKVKDPKTEAGRRAVAIPPHLTPAIETHLSDHAALGADGLLFPANHGQQLAPSTLYRAYYPARDKANRPDLRFHDLRHTGAVLAASTGATLAELMARLGHSTPSAAMRYQHAALDRDKVIAGALSRLVT